MQITTIEVSRTRSNGDYGNDKISLRADVGDGEDVEAAIQTLRARVAHQVALASGTDDDEDRFDDYDDARAAAQAAGTGNDSLHVATLRADLARMTTRASELYEALKQHEDAPPQVASGSHAAPQDADYWATRATELASRLADAQDKLHDARVEATDLRQARIDPWDGEKGWQYWKQAAHEMTAQANKALGERNALIDDVQQEHTRAEALLAERDALAQQATVQANTIAALQAQLANADPAVAAQQQHIIASLTAQSVSLSHDVEAVAAERDAAQARVAQDEQYIRGQQQVIDDKTRETNQLVDQLREAREECTRLKRVDDLLRQEAHEQQNELDERQRTINALRNRERVAAMPAAAAAGGDAVARLEAQNADLARQLAALQAIGETITQLDADSAPVDVLRTEVKRLQHLQGLDQAELARLRGATPTFAAYGQTAAPLGRGTATSVDFTSKDSLQEASVTTLRAHCAELVQQLDRVGRERHEWETAAMTLRRDYDALVLERDRVAVERDLRGTDGDALAADLQVAQARVQVLQHDLKAAEERWEMSNRSDVQAQARNLQIEVDRVREALQQMTAERDSERVKVSMQLDELRRRDLTIATLRDEREQGITLLHDSLAQRDAFTRTLEAERNALLIEVDALTDAAAQRSEEIDSLHRTVRDVMAERDEARAEVGRLTNAIVALRSSTTNAYNELGRRFAPLDDKVATMTRQLAEAHQTADHLRANAAAAADALAARTGERDTARQAFAKARREREEALAKVADLHATLRANEDWHATAKALEQQRDVAETRQAELAASVQQARRERDAARAATVAHDDQEAQ